MATNTLYRLNGEEVLKISPLGQTWPDRDTNYYGVLVDPTYTDGIEYLDPDDQRRVLGYAKIVDAGAVRNATQPEIDGWAAAQTADENVQDRDGAENLFITHPRFRKLMTAYSDILKDEFNILRLWTHDFQEEVANATSLADLKTRVAALPTLHDRTLAQLKTAIRNRLSEND